jgi:hypothetical protein
MKLRFQTVFDESELIVSEDIYDEEEKKHIFKQKALRSFIDLAIRKGYISVTCERVGDVFSPESDDKPSSNMKDFFVYISARFRDE